VRATGSYGQTALMVAARQGNTDAMTLLLNKGAEPKRVKKGGWTALMIAAGKGEVEAV
jgi:ankyrin repeat protein